jgi:signal recognition particle receptor subunit beta
VKETEVNLVLWDFYGDDNFQKIRWSSFQGASGYLLVADGTRRATFDKAIELEELARKQVGPLPFLFLMNKWDLADQWELDSEMEARIAAKDWETLRTSAKTGEGVEEAFAKLTEKMLR